MLRSESEIQSVVLKESELFRKLFKPCDCQETDGLIKSFFVSGGGGVL